MENTSKLTKEELEYIKKVIVSPNLKDQGTYNILQWWGNLTMKVIKKTATPEEIIQYNRIREIENLMTILTGKVPETILDYIEISGTLDEQERESILKAMVETTSQDIKEGFELKYLKEQLEEAYGEALNEDLIERHINEFQREHKNQEQYERMYEIIENMEFKNLSDENKFDVLLSLFTETKEGKNKKISIDVKDIDREMLLYLILKYSNKLSKTIGDNSSSKKM